MGTGRRTRLGASQMLGQMRGQGHADNRPRARHGMGFMRMRGMPSKCHGGGCWTAAAMRGAREWRGSLQHTSERWQDGREAMKSRHAISPPVCCLVRGLRGSAFAVSWAGLSQ